MKLRSLPVFLFVAGALLALTGCSTFESRSKQKAAAFAALDPTAQARLKAGDIRIGDRVDEVYIALGYPDEKRDVTTAKGNTLVWIYSRYWQEYQGSSFAPPRPIYVQDPTTKVVSVYYETVRQPVYANRSEERLRITFEDGRVTVIEKAK
jgi:hypothetical protein